MSENNELDDKQIDKKSDTIELILEYGDIIEIHAPRNKDIHEYTFFITYIDETNIKLTNVSTLLLHELNISEEGQITDESIETIELLSRADEKGYARQNGLIPKKWVDIHFGGDFPIILSGEITNLDEDMIELTTYPDLDVLYIDFEYKGLPKHIPIQTIQIRKKPEQLAKTDTLTLLRGVDDEFGDSSDSSASIEITESGESIISIPENALPDKNIRDALHSLYIDANDVIFGNEEEEIIQVVEIAENERKYTIETQVNSLMDELLSTIPNSQRTKDVLDNIQRIITRFKELRVKFSVFNENNSIVNPKLVGPDYKPIIDHIKKIDINLKWLLPVVQSKAKLYSITSEPVGDATTANRTDDIILLSNDANLKEQQLIQDDYYENNSKGDTVKIKEMLKRINPYMTPYESIHNESTLYNSNVQTNIDAVVNNLENFESTIIQKNEMSKRQFIIRRYNMAVSTMEPQILKTGRRVFLRKNIYNNDNMSIKSFITLPQSIMKYSKTGLPCTNIMERTSLALNPPLLFRILKQKTKIDQFIVDQFKTEIDYEKMEEETKLHFLSTMKEYILDDTLSDENDKLEKFLKVIMPNSRNLIRLVRPYIQDKLTLVEIVKELEPFMVYIEDITYKQYMEIRYFIKERITEFKKMFAQKLIDFTVIKNTKYNVLQSTQGIEHILHDMKSLIDIFIDGYKFDHLKQTKQLRTAFDIHPTELLSNIIKMDNGQLLFNLISFDKLSLMIPDNFLNTLQLPSIGDMGNIEKIKANDCIRRFLVKRYSSLHDLQKDNQEEIICDKEFDDSPYDILKKYKNEQMQMSSEDFIDFLAENLIAKHDCPINISIEMSKTIIRGKKIVVDGEYAILELKPQLPKHIDESALSSKDKDSIKIEEDANKIIHYYRRLKTNWVRDDSIDETAFIDNNTLFCNMNKMCFKNTSNSICEPLQDASTRMKIIAKRKLILEADSRYEKSIEDMKDEFDIKIEYFMKSILKNNTLKEIQLYKSNNYAFELGNIAETSEIIQSPYIRLRDYIVSQDDFVKRQQDIQRFVQEFTREPMVNELSENAFWLYCKETNTKLLPYMLYKLSTAFLSGQNYQSVLDELCRTQGELSDDGDSIIDKYSGEVIRKIDFSSEEGYDEAGFKMTTNEIIQKDLKTVVEEALQNKDKIFENETTQTIYNIFITLCENLGIPDNGMESLIIRLSVELIETNIKKESVYEAFSEKMEKQKGKRPIAYKLYRHQTIILMVASVLLIGLQTTTPSYKPKITVPGCIRSFSGFPLNGGEEDSTGLQYIACTVNKTKSAISPWNSMKGMPLQIIAKGIRQILTEMLINRTDISELYIKKREYLLLHPEETIPEEHSIVKWQSFLPPVVQFSVKKTLQNITNELKADFIELMQNGHNHQHEVLNVFKSKLLSYGYGVIEQINEIVSKKEVLLKTSANIPFLQNACCGDRNTINALTYFMDESPEIEQYLKIIMNLSEIVVNTKELTQSPVLFHPLNTAVIRPIIPTAHFDTNIYASFIYYCRFDRNIPVPIEFQKICSERPPGYNSSWSLEEKIKFLKENGKRFTIDQLHQLMDIVYNKNQIERATTNTFSKIEALREILEFLDEKESNVIDKRLIDCLLNVISDHNPTQFVMEDNESTEKLKNYLTISNNRMYESIYNFLDKYGNLDETHLDNLDKFITNIMSWTIDSSQSNTKLYYEEGLYSITQFIQNSIFSMTKVFPEIIKNNVEINTVPLHWGLSQDHKRDVIRFIKQYYNPLQKFKKDKTILLFLREIQLKLIDVNIFIQNIPIYTPIHKEENTFYSLFDKQTIFMLLKYIWYSVIYEYIITTDDTDLLHVDIEENKSARRTNKANQLDVTESLQTVYTDNLSDNALDYMENLNDIEVSIKIGNLQDFKNRTAQLLIAFLDIELTNKNSIDLTYNKINEKMNRSKQTEKKMITDFFRDMDSDERKVQNLKKTYKMGRWNVGMQKGLVEYDKTTYDRERSEIIEHLNNTNELDDDVAIMQREIYDIERDEADAIEQEYDNEANNIDDLGEDYGDNYENNDDDDFGRES